MPGRAKRVRTSATKPGITIVLTLVEGSKNPWITSGAVRRNLTGVSTGTCAPPGPNAYCSATILTVTAPSGSAAVPRLLSTNSPPRCSVVGSMVSTLLGGLSAWVTPVTTMTTIMTASIVAMRTSQRFSVRATSCSGMIPSGSGLGGFVMSANGSSRHEQEEIEREPPDEEQRHGNAGEVKRAVRAMLERRHDY